MVYTDETKTETFKKNLHHPLHKISYHATTHKRLRVPESYGRHIAVCYAGDNV